MPPPGDRIFRFSMKKGGINIYGEIFGISMHFMPEGCTCGYGEVELVTNSWSSSHPSSSSDSLILATFPYFGVGNFSEEILYTKVWLCKCYVQIEPPFFV